MLFYPRCFFRGARAFVPIAGLSLFFILPAVFAEGARPSAPVALFNGRDLTGWVIVGKEGDPKAKETWSVRDGVLAASGSPYGYLRTAETYRDYALRVEWRWTPGPAPTGPGGKPRGRNSGVLLHIQPEERFWPVCLEAQLHEGSAGDFIAMTLAIGFDELRAVREKNAAAAGTDEAARQRALNARQVPKQQPSAEKPLGEWNTYEIVCRGDSVTLKVNGVRQNTATGLSIREGAIGLQSEGAPIEFRNVKLLPLPN